MTQPQRVCIIGAECTGKTTLARQLAAHFSCPWVPEYLRDFCDAYGRTPKRGEQAHILESQHTSEMTAFARATDANQAFVFCDTAPLLTAIYSDFIFGDRSLYAKARALHGNYALTLLLASDIAWVADGVQRDGAQVRQPITQRIVHELDVLKAPLAPVAGQAQERIAAALAAIHAQTLRRGETDHQRLATSSANTEA
jgi:nicotinamide riboside kinase